MDLNLTRTREKIRDSSMICDPEQNMEPGFFPLLCFFFLSFFFLKPFYFFTHLDNAGIFLVERSQIYNFFSISSKGACDKTLPEKVASF